MPPIRFLLRCRPGAGGQLSSGQESSGQESGQESDRQRRAGAEVREGGVAIEIRPLRAADDLAAVAELAAQCRAFDTDMAGGWSPRGLRAELTGREGRRVHGWLAWPTGPHADRSPVGMVAVVDVGRRPLVRASIAWLLVHPAVRRRGVATALVRRALEEVCRLGGDVVSAETLSSWPAAIAFWGRFAEGAGPAPRREGTSRA